MSSRKVRIKVPGKARRRVPPKTDELEILIRDLASDGRGVGEASDGQVIFVAGGKYSDKCMFLRVFW